MDPGELHSRIRKPKELSTATIERLKSSIKKLSATAFADDRKLNRNITSVLVKLVEKHHT